MRADGCSRPTRPSCRAAARSSPSPWRSCLRRRAGSTSQTYPRSRCCRRAQPSPSSTRSPSPAPALALLQPLTAQPIDSIKLQQHGHRQLSPPVRLFDFDWATSPLDELLKPRTSAPLRLSIEASGTLTAFVIYFSLDLDGTPPNLINSGPRSPNIAWDQSVRYLPVGLKVRKADVLAIVAKHSDCHLASIALHNFSTDMVVTDVGRADLVANPSAAKLTAVLAGPIAATRAERAALLSKFDDGAPGPG